MLLFTKDRNQKSEEQKPNLEQRLPDISLEDTYQLLTIPDSRRALWIEGI